MTHDCQCEMCKKVKTLEQSRANNQKQNVLYRLNEAKEVMRQAGMFTEANICEALEEAIKTGNVEVLRCIMQVGTETLIKNQISRN